MNSIQILDQGLNYACVGGGLKWLGEKNGQKPERNLLLNNRGRHGPIYKFTAFLYFFN